MAITKLGHMKENKKGNPSGHLKEAIRYILNPDKTGRGLWAGGVCGTDAEEVYRCMMQTKQEFGKENGRQAYHFVISFAPGECSERTAFMIGKEFCERYLGNEFQYVFSVHNDQPHMHCHIVFNSVSQIDGRKYRYENGSWEADIQPITDALCRKYHLSALTFERENKKGTSYAENRAAKAGKLIWKDIIYADLDAAIQKAASFDMFCRILRSSGYEIREGLSERYGIYYSYKAPGADRARRDYRLGTKYRREAIEERIRHKEREEKPSYRISIGRAAAFSVKGASYLQVLYIRRIRQATDWHYFAFQRKEQARVRKDLLALDRLSEECAYLIEKNISSPEDVESRLAKVRRDIRIERKLIKAASGETERFYEKTEAIKESLLNVSDEEAEKLMDELESLYASHPELLLGYRIKGSARLEALKRENRILTRIMKGLPETMAVRDLEMQSRLTVIKKEELTHG